MKNNQNMVQTKLLKIEYLWDIEGWETDAVNIVKFFGENGVNKKEELIKAIIYLKDNLVERYGLTSTDLLFIYYNILIAKCIKYQKNTNKLIQDNVNQRLADLNVFLRTFGQLIKNKQVEVAWFKQ